MLELYDWCRRHTHNCILVCSKDTPEADGRAIKWEMTTTPYLNAIELLIPFQVIAHRGALITGQSSLIAAYPNALRELNGLILS